ncbi:hypothetical protein SISNIDRAFT_478773 [Sistotremastrum niveocremeum HHB9708]|uniref:DNA polymerase n=1 Tax=Sistotremastrum niveocremeum HHB9708 TaxID=1314777 RepID=A0A164U6J5_9AGAM|nr:hypothetical protein SISNIDRAFT_478773 [Sistotremastrum niveocremeum HHB9708]
MSQEPVLRVRLNQIDYTLAPPEELDRAPAFLSRVPVLRVYGQTSIGIKACVNIHQVFPYFYIDYLGSLNPDHVNAYISRMAHSINYAIAISLKRNPHAPKSQYVRGIVLVKGIPFYGFHTAYSPYLKIYMADPNLITRTVTLLQAGTIMRSRFTVYESHISYPLQFMCDFGLYGCGWLDLGEISVRGAMEDVDKPVIKLPIPHEISPLFKQSQMELEIDVIAPHILNRRHLEARDLHYKLQIPGIPLPSEPLVHSVRELWNEERARRTAKGMPPTPDMPFSPEDRERGPGGQWASEDRSWDIINRRIESETGKHQLPRSRNWENWAMKSFDSTEALWDRHWRTQKPKPGVKNETGLDSDQMLFLQDDISTKNENDVDVDAALIDANLDQLLLDSERQWAEELSGRDAENLHEEIDIHDDISGALQFEEGPPPELIDDESTREDQSHEYEEDPFITTVKTEPDRFSSIWGRASSSERQFESEVLISTLSAHQEHAVHNDLNFTTECDEQLEAYPQDDPLSPSRDEQTPMDETEWIATVLDEPVSPALYGSLMRERPVQVPTQRTAPSIPPWAPDPASLIPTQRHSFQYCSSPPSADSLMKSLPTFGLRQRLYTDPYYSVASDVPSNAPEFGGIRFRLFGNGIASLEEWNTESVDPTTSQFTHDSENIYGWEYAMGDPPSVKTAKQWLKTNPLLNPRAKKKRSQIEGVSPENQYGFKGTQRRPNKNIRATQGMTLFSLELFASSQGDRLPNPERDEIIFVCYAFQDSEFKPSEDGPADLFQKGTIVVESSHLNRRRLRGLPVEVVRDELELINYLIDKVVQLDPDIIVGWEVQAASWGYLDARARSFGMDLGDQISRAPPKPGSRGYDQWGLRTTSTFHVVGRHVLNVWRIMRVELSLTMYTFENVAFHLLRRRIPKYSPSVLTSWCQSHQPGTNFALVTHVLNKCVTTLEILSQAETVTKNSEFARVFGVDFFSVISRGSQFKVESFMFRIAKPESLILISPSKIDVGKQNAAECIPLIMEPLSAFYKSPLLVLDFQSLYPSVMIAYNYCYSTCLGRVEPFKAHWKFGILEDLEQPAGLLETLKEHITVAPNGIMYVKATVRKGLLGKMLSELLETRIMVKQAMKSAKGDKALLRVLNARQLSLKFICNVTYGYTSATYSGRMPAVEIADSIVQTGRETLEKAIDLIESTKKWNAKVVYGDTDSVFVSLAGRTKDEAFRIGEEIANAVTASNPAPIKLKFEKVYFPCVLMAKKRYVGYKYENPDDVEPVFDAKGIETVRRDGIPAQAKMVERSLRILFRTQDLSQVKAYCQETWFKMHAGRASIQDFIFSKEVRLGTYSDKGPPPPGAAVAGQRLLEDENDEPQYGDRVPYVIARGEPGSRLVDRAVAPEGVVLNRHKRLDFEYYIGRVLIPPLYRIFSLLGADVHSWYADTPRAAYAIAAGEDEDEDVGMPLMEEHFQGIYCAVCGDEAEDVICEHCQALPKATTHSLMAQTRMAETRYADAASVCQSCTGSSLVDVDACVSLDCPWFYQRKKLEYEVETLKAALSGAEELFSTRDSRNPNPHPLDIPVLD